MIEIGAFDAKTHFSELLRRVEAGESFCVTHRGRQVAVIKAARKSNKSKKTKPATTLASLKRDKDGHFIIDDQYREYAKRTVGAWIELRKTSPIKATLKEIIAWKNEGRP